MNYSALPKSEGNWHSNRTSPLDDLLGALRHAGTNGKISILGWKAVEIYEASEASQAQIYKEGLKQLASAARNLVYAILRAPQEISSQDSTLNYVENILNRVLRAISTVQRSSSTKRGQFDPLVPTPLNPVRRKPNNPFLPLIESGGLPHDATLHVAPFVPPVATDISLGANHVRGSASTVSKVNKSTRENYNNVTHNVTTNFNGNVFMSAFPAGYHPSPSLGGAYGHGYLDYNAPGGHGAPGRAYHGGNGGWIPVFDGGNGESSTDNGLNNYRG
ncbi:hypothetical protein BDP27DRAFT_1404960 [Rhodocollybia butyracea]|uniref:Uncharacterized protein n=1 Tax=Rhodocollybia butyracea TaxID=206335 RepID=A0A9P5PGW4_9AGAR|nr:hypothetical protein BDP27DRAFT_1404960 [Rhodocollybia butyracea]